MKVRELIQALETLPGDLIVVTEYDGWVQTIDAVRLTTMGAEFHSANVGRFGLQAADDICLIE